MKKHVRNVFFLCAALLSGVVSFCQAPDANGVLYVSKSAASSGTGSSWASAVKELSDALKAAAANNAIKEIWVAKGTYTPLYTAETNGDGSNTRKNSFVLVSNTKVLGGFAGTEASSANRNYTANPTVLSGDIGTVGVSTDNVHFVVAANGISGTTLDGFTIANGYSNEYGGFVINNIFAETNFGSGMWLGSSTGITLSNCIFSGNYTEGGGALGILYGSSAKISQCAFINNSGQFWGGAIFAKNNLSVTITNSSFSGNTATTGAGILAFFDSYKASDSVTVRNCVFSNNSGGAAFSRGFYGPTNYVNCTLVDNSGGQTGLENWPNDATGPLPIFANCIIYAADTLANPVSYNPDAIVYRNTLTNGGTLGSNIGSTANILLADPVFTNYASGNYSVQSPGAAINNGSSTYYTLRGGNLTTDKDFVGNARLAGTSIDIGAYESTVVLPVTLLYFTAQASGSSALLQWKTATEINNNYFDIMRSADGITFTAIGRVKGHGTSGTASSYSFTDAAPLEGNNYYRLKQVDIDGKAILSSIASVPFAKTAKLKAWFTSASSLFVSLPPANVRSDLRVYDAAGRILFTRTVAANTASIVIDCSSLTGGVYFLHYSNETISLIK